MIIASTETPPANPTAALVSEPKIADLLMRLTHVVWPRRSDGVATPGFDTDRLRPMVERWRDGFDWRDVEARLKELGHVVTTAAEGRRLQALQVPGGDGVPVLLVHGWPDSPLRFVELIPRLVSAGHAVVAPSIPGVGFSEEPAGEMSREWVAEDFHRLMLQLGHVRYAVHGGDWGSAIATTLAALHPEAVVALHLTDVPFDLAFTIDPETAPEAEIAYLRDIEQFANAQVYLTANCQQPDLLALALENSPVALLGWIAHLYDQWSDDDIDVDHLLANASLLWLTGTIRSSMRLYSEPAGSWDESSWDDVATWESADAERLETGEAGARGHDDAGSGEDSHPWAPARVEVPTAFALFPKDLGTAPRGFAERHFAVERFTIMPRGGHFAALEQPELLASDIVAFLEGRA